MKRIPSKELLEDWTEYITGLVKYGLMPDDIKEYTIEKVKKIRPNEQQVALAIMKLRKGYELDQDITISTSLNQIMIVKGKLEIYAQLALALIRKYSRESRIHYVEMTNAKAELKVKRYADQDYWNTYSFSKPEAELADLWITKEKINLKPKLRSSPWKKYPKTMLLYSAIRLMVKFEFSDIVLLDVANVYETENVTYSEQDLLHDGGKTKIIKQTPFLPKKETPLLESKEEKKKIPVKKSVKKKEKEVKTKIIDVEPEKPEKPEKPKKEEKKIEKKVKKIQPKSLNNLDIQLDLDIVAHPPQQKSTEKKGSSEKKVKKNEVQPKKKSNFNWALLESTTDEEKKLKNRAILTPLFRNGDYFVSTKNKSKTSQDFPYNTLEGNIMSSLRDMGRNANRFTEIYSENLANKTPSDTLAGILMDSVDDLCGEFDLKKLKSTVDKRFEFYMTQIITKLLRVAKDGIESNSNEMSINDFKELIIERTGWGEEGASNKFNLWAFDFLKARKFIIIKEDKVRLG